jgi:hypothetical protein
MCTHTNSYLIPPGWPKSAHFSHFNTQTIHIKSFYTQQHGYVSLKTLYHGGIRTRAFSFLRQMRCPLRHAARAPILQHILLKKCEFKVWFLLEIKASNWRSGPVVSFPPATEETGAMGVEIEPRQGNDWYLWKIKVSTEIEMSPSCELAPLIILSNR